MKSKYQQAFQSIIQALYWYKESLLFGVHLSAIFIVGIAIIYVSIREWKCRDHAYSYKQLVSTQHKSVPEFKAQAIRHTNAQVKKLRQSPAYTRYLQEKARPDSYVNRHIEVEEIVFSDEEDEPKWPYLPQNTRKKNY